jgi:hypothetical protein
VVFASCSKQVENCIGMKLFCIEPSARDKDNPRNRGEFSTIGLIQSALRKGWKPIGDRLMGRGAFAGGINVDWICSAVREWVAVRVRLHSKNERRSRVKRIKLLIAGVTGFALLCLFGAPAVHAQLLDGTVHDAKVRASAFAFIPMAGLVKVGGKASIPAVLRATGPNMETGGFDYEINILIDTGLGAPCVEENAGMLSTYAGEEVGIVALAVSGFPEVGQTLVGRLFAKVKTTPGKAGFKTVSGWTEIEDGAPPDPDGISKTARLQLKEKAAAKLVDCTP